MGEKTKLAMRVLILGGVFLSLFMTSYAEVRLNTIPAPPPTAKLRVLALPLTGSAPPGGWGTPHEEFERKQFGAIRYILQETGIYALPTWEEFRTVVGTHRFSSRDWRKKDRALAKQVGQALFAEYVMIIERNFSAGVRYREVSLINLETGREFSVLFRVPKEARYKEEWVRVGRVAVREIFRDAKGDMLATAMRKRGLSPAGGPSPVAERSKEPVAPAMPIPSKEPKKPASLPSGMRQVDLEEALKERPVPARALVAVYDLSASEPLRVAALILSEALREELFHQGYFTLVNRENMVQVLNEMGVQQTDLVDEKQAVQAGKGLAAHQIILGQFGALGRTLLLQVKRIDVETQTTLSLGSLKGALGKEEELLANLPELARKLAGR